MVPDWIRRWFVIHFAVDWLVGLPLFIAPEALLRLFGWHPIDPLSTRLFAAALLGIGGQSFIGRNARLAEFRGMLNLKLIWAAAAVVAFLISVLTRGPALAWLGLATFIAFFGLWLYWALRLRQQTSAFKSSSTRR